jgi:hypothetical protein
MSGDEAVELLTTKVREAIQEAEKSIGAHWIISAIVKAFREEAASLKKRECHIRAERYQVAAEVLRDAL